MTDAAGILPTLADLADHVRAERIAVDLAALAGYTATPGEGVTRLAYTEQDRAARDWIVAAMEAAGLAVRVDAAGNVFGRRDGTEPGRAAVASGSHYDSVVHAGAFDGLAGLVCALEAVRALADAGITTRAPIVVIAIAAEESARFRGFSRIGSRALAGVLDEATLTGVADGDGVSLRDAMASTGLEPDRIAEACLPPGAIDAFVELHIEQGTLLIDAHGGVGVVDAITGASRLRVRVTGRTDHSGATQMTDRRDALVAAAELVIAVERAALKVGGGVVATVGDLTVTPGSMSVVPGTATLLVDIRDVGPGQQQVLHLVREAIDQLARARDVAIDIDVLRDDPATPMSPRVVADLDKAARELGIPAVHVPSRSGHDTITMADLCDVGMVFVRNASGRSHSPDEQVELDDVERGARLLVAVLARLAHHRTPGDR